MRRLFFQIVLGVSFLSIAVLLLSQLLMFTVYEQYNRDSVEEKIASEYSRLAPKIADKTYQQTVDFLFDYQFATAELEVEACRLDSLPHYIRQSLQLNPGGPVSANDDSLFLSLYYPQGDKDWGLCFYLDEEDISGAFFLFILPIGLVIFALVVGLVWAFKRFAKPLLKLEQAAQRLGQGDVHARAIVDQKSPVYSLSSQFNHMADQLEELFRQQQTLIGAIPHELRSPLHRIRFALDMTRQSSDMDTLRQRIDNIDGYVNELQAATTDLLELSRLQQGTVLRHSEVSLCPLLVAVRDRVAADYVNSNIHVECQTAITITANRPLLMRALLNLTRNACQYGHSQITLKAKQHDGEINITVSDDGSGIPKQYHQQIFTPFFRIDQSRDRGTGGVGLGLALVKMIIEKHQGHIQVNSAEQGGTSMEITLPEEAFRKL